MVAKDGRHEVVDDLNRLMAEEIEASFAVFPDALPVARRRLPPRGAVLQERTQANDGQLDVVRTGLHSTLRRTLPRSILGAGAPLRAESLQTRPPAQPLKAA
jgi:hypothetical protein